MGKVKPFGRHGYLLNNKQKLVYNILTPSIIAIYKFLWTYGGSGHIIRIMTVACRVLIREKALEDFST